MIRLHGWSQGLLRLLVMSEQTSGRSIYTHLCAHARLALLDRRDQSGRVSTCPNLVLCIMTTVGTNTSECRAEDLQSVSVTQS